VHLPPVHLPPVEVHQVLQPGEPPTTTKQAVAVAEAIEDVEATKEGVEANAVYHNSLDLRAESHR